MDIRRIALIRLIICGVVAVTIAAGLGIRATIEPGPSWLGTFSWIAGEILYTVLIYELIVLINPRARPILTFAVALGFSCAVEFFKLTGVSENLAHKSVFARLVLGSTFNVANLPWYAVGAGLALIVHIAIRSRYSAVAR